MSLFFSPLPSPFSSLPISLSCRGWLLEADHLPSLLSLWPSFTCATASLLDLLPSLSLSLSLSSSLTRRLLLPSSPSPSFTSPLPWSPSATLFLPDVLPVGDLGIRKGVQILRHLRLANSISPLTSFFSLSSVAATKTVGSGPSSIADRRRLLDLLRRWSRSLTVDLLPSCLRPPPLPPLPVILTVNLTEFLCLVVLPPRRVATAGGIGTLVKPWCLAVVIWSWDRFTLGEDTKPSLFG